jgi:hypothetical protein
MLLQVAGINAGCRRLLRERRERSRLTILVRAELSPDGLAVVQDRAFLGAAAVVMSRRRFIGV